MLLSLLRARRTLLAASILLAGLGLTLAQMASTSTLEAHSQDAGAPAWVQAPLLAFALVGVGGILLMTVSGRRRTP